MKKLMVLLALLTVFVTACHTPLYKVETAYNTYNAHLTYYKAVCQAPTKGPVGCQRLDTALTAFLAADTDAALALTRGGAQPVQIAAVAATQKNVDYALANMNKP